MSDPSPSGRWETPPFALQASLPGLILSVCSSSLTQLLVLASGPIWEGAAHSADGNIETRKGEETDLRSHKKMN